MTISELRRIINDTRLNPHDEVLFCGVLFEPEDITFEPHEQERD